MLINGGERTWWASIKALKKKMITNIIVLLIICQFIVIYPIESDSSISIWTNKSEYCIGESIEIYFRLGDNPATFQIKIWDYATDGSANVIYENGSVVGGRTYTLRARVSGPPGVERLKMGVWMYPSFFYEEVWAQFQITENCGSQNPCATKYCENKCSEGNFWKMKCDPQTGNCVFDYIIEKCSSQCGCNQDPCANVSCPYSQCYGNELWKIKCENGNCVKDYLIESCSSQCGCNPCPTVYDPYNSGCTNSCPDSDGDGIPNCKDKCPYEWGPGSNNGCPQCNCPDQCYGNELWRMRCSDGQCVKDYRLENCSSQCGCNPNPCATTNCPNTKCYGNELWKIKCQYDNCVKDYLMDSCSSQCGCNPNPCANVYCPDTQCYGNELWRMRCSNGQCLKDYRLESCSSQCGCTKSQCPTSYDPNNPSCTSSCPDSDKDGVPDCKDKCPDTGSCLKVDSQGCPIQTPPSISSCIKLMKCPQNLEGKCSTYIPQHTYDLGQSYDIETLIVQWMTGWQDCLKGPTTFQISNDKTNWQTIGLADGSGHQWTEKTFSNLKKVRYVKISAPSVYVDDSRICIKGNPAEDPCSKDDDGDGVSNCKDKCNNPDCSKVDSNGCPLDSDSDGIRDCDDKCPNEKGPASNNGCPCNCPNECYGKELWKMKCSNGICVRDTRIENCSSQCGCCINCPDQQCFGKELWEMECSNGQCVKKSLVDNCSSQCGCTKPQCPTSYDPNNPNCTSKCPDSDGDGVPDCRDLCKKTPSGTKVNKDGCPVEETIKAIITNVTGIPDKCKFAESFTIKVYIRNNGSSSQTFTVEAVETNYVIVESKGSGDNTKQIKLAPNEEKYVEFKITVTEHDNADAFYIMLSDSSGNRLDTKRIEIDCREMKAEQEIRVKVADNIYIVRFFKNGTKKVNSLNGSEIVGDIRKKAIFTAQFVKDSTSRSLASGKGIIVWDYLSGEQSIRNIDLEIDDTATIAAEIMSWNTTYPSLFFGIEYYSSLAGIAKEIITGGEELLREITKFGLSYIDKYFGTDFKTNFEIATLDFKGLVSDSLENILTGETKKNIEKTIDSMKKAEKVAIDAYQDISKAKGIANEAKNVELEIKNDIKNNEPVSYEDVQKLFDRSIEFLNLNISSTQNEDQTNTLLHKANDYGYANLIAEAIFYSTIMNCEKIKSESNVNPTIREILNNLCEKSKPFTPFLKGRLDQLIKSIDDYKRSSSDLDNKLKGIRENRMNLTDDLRKVNNYRKELDNISNSS